MKLVEGISALALIILFLTVGISCDQNVTNPGRMKGQNDKAIADYNKAIELNPRDAEAYNNRGLAYSKSGFSGPSSLCATPGQCLRLSIKDFDQAIRINPNYVPWPISTEGIPTSIQARWIVRALIGEWLVNWVFVKS